MPRSSAPKNSSVQALDGVVSDVAAEIGPRIPAAVMCDVLGVPATDQDMLIELTNHAFGGEDELFNGRRRPHDR